MTKNNLPPQAYTREDVAKAYVWIQTQPEHIKNMATTKDALIALYLQARRNGISSLEHIAPVSSKDFKTQLQSLASELNQFEKPEVPSAPDFVKNFGYDQKIQFQNVEPDYNERSIEVKVSEKRAPHTLALDHRSLEIIENIKSKLNLESDQEVLKMLITLGYDRLKSVFPQE